MISRGLAKAGTKYAAAKIRSTVTTRKLRGLCRAAHPGTRR